MEGTKKIKQRTLYFCHFSLLMYFFVLVWDLEEVGRRTQQ